MDIIKGIKWQGTSQVLTRGMSFFVMIYLGMVLTSNDFALIGIAFVVIGLFDLISEFGLGVALVQWQELNREITDQIFWITLLTGFAIASLCWFSSDQIEFFFNKDGVASLIRVLSSVIILNALSVVPFKLLVRDLRFSTTAKIELMSKGINWLVVGVCAALGQGVWALVYGQVTSSMVKLILSYLYKPYLPIFIFSKSFFLQKDFFALLKSGVNIVGLRFSWYGRNQIDKIIGGRYLSAENFGYYSFAFQLVRNVQDIIQGVLRTIALPILSKNRDNPSNFEQTFMSLIRYSLIISLPLFVGGILVAQDILLCLFGSKWLNSTNVFQVACFVSLLRIVNTTIEEVYIALGTPHYSLLANIAGSVFLGLTFYFASAYGIAGFNIAWVVAFPIYLVLWIFFTFKKISIDFVNFAYAIAPAFIGGTFLVLAVSLTSYSVNSQWAATFSLKIYICLFLKILSGGIGYFIGLFLWDNITGNGVIKTILGRKTI